MFGTAVLGGLCAYPVAILLMGRVLPGGLLRYIIPFLISTGAGAIISGAVIYSLKKAGFVQAMAESLEERYAR